MKVPDNIWKLGEARQAARQEKNFSRADGIRDELLVLGWEVIDFSGQFELRRKSRYTQVATLSELKSYFEGEAICIAMIVSGFTEDASACVTSIRDHSDVPIFIIVHGEVGALEEKVSDRTVIVKVVEESGWGATMNAALHHLGTKFVVVMDPSTLFDGDAITPVLNELIEAEYSAVGWRGGLVNVEDEWRSVEDKGQGEVDVLFSYFVAMNRNSAIEVGGFNGRAIYYRNADIEFSLRLRQTGGRLLQMDLPLKQARHHGYYDVDADFREVQSKKNYDRILERFRGKSAILCERR